MILSFTLDSLIHFLAKVTQYIVGKEYSENSFSTSKTLYCCTLLDKQVSLFSCITKLFKLDQPRSREQIASIICGAIECIITRLILDQHRRTHRWRSFVVQLKLHHQTEDRSLAILCFLLLIGTRIKTGELSVEILI